MVLATEHGLKLPANPEAAQAALVEHLGCASDKLVVCGKEDWFSPVASGSAAPKQMVVCPCSAGSVAAIAHGMSDNLIERAADVVLKERGQLLLVVRETPFSTLHLENMLKLSHMGVTIMPAAPGFYHQPQSIDDLVDFMVARILDHLGIEQALVPRWGYDQRARRVMTWPVAIFRYWLITRFPITIQPTHGGHPFIRMALRSSTAWDPQ